MADYFETYQDNDPDFGFLDEYTLRDFLSFWATWKRIYPLVYDLNLLSYSEDPGDGPARLGRRRPRAPERGLFTGSRSGPTSSRAGTGRRDSIS